MGCIVPMWPFIDQGLARGCRALFKGMSAGRVLATVVAEVLAPQLAPYDLRDWVPEDDLAHFVIEAVERVGIGAFEANDRGTGSALAHAAEPALRGEGTQREGVPVTGGEGPETLPDARGCRRQRRTHR